MAQNTEKPNDINRLGPNSTVWGALAKLGRPEGSEGSPNEPASEGGGAGTALVVPPTPIHEALVDHFAVAQAYLASRVSTRTEQTMREALERIAKLLECDIRAVPWAAIRRDEVQRLFVQLRRRYSRRTVNLTMAALRGVLGEAWDRGLMSGDDYARILRIKTLKVNRLPKGRGLADDEIERINAHCRALGPEGRDWPESAYGAFLRAAFALMFGLGLRASEASTVTLDAYDRRGRSFRVIGKGDKEREAPLNEDEYQALEEWLAVRAELDIPPDIRSVLVRVRRSGGLHANMLLNRRKLEHLCKLEAKRAGVMKFSPHDLRRTFATDLLVEGTDLATVQRLMGHESPATTGLYDRRPAELDAAARRKVTLLGRKAKGGG